MDTEEMYRRGVADAEKGEAHPFYYQHYYQYRRGYDQARRRLGLPGGSYDLRQRQRTRLLLAAAALLAIAVAFFAWRGRTQPIAARAPTAEPSVPAVTTAPTRPPFSPTPTAPPTAAARALHVGGAATIANTQGAPLRGRKQPGVKSPVVANFKEGERVRVVDGPATADGFTWWKIEGPSGTGWSAQQSKDGLVWIEPRAD